MNLIQIKQRFGIVGNNPSLNRALEVAAQVAPTDLSVLVTGESGTGKEIIPQVIHQLSSRKHKEYIAVNCGAIPEGTIDSELFGHEKGSFTGAAGSRQGYFETANGGTIFLDEVAELPMQTQVRLLRVLETGEFMRVGASKPQKTNVRVVAATNEPMQKAIAKGKFREDLFYRLSAIPVHLPPLRERGEDIHLLFRKFASDFAERYRMPTIRLEPEAISLLSEYTWPGNIRQLKNTVEQISIIETERSIPENVLQQYLTPVKESVPSLMVEAQQESINERELMYKFLFDMKRDLTDLKKLVVEVLNQSGGFKVAPDHRPILEKLYQDIDIAPLQGEIIPQGIQPPMLESTPVIDEHFVLHEEYEESLSLEERERELITKALEKHRGKRKHAAQELGISERTLYRKIKEFKLGE